MHQLTVLQLLLDSTLLSSMPKKTESPFICVFIINEIFCRMSFRSNTLFETATFFEVFGFRN